MLLLPYVRTEREVNESLSLIDLDLDLHLHLNLYGWSLATNSNTKDKFNCNYNYKLQIIASINEMEWIGSDRIGWEERKGKGRGGKGIEIHWEKGLGGIDGWMDGWLDGIDGEIQWGVNATQCNGRNRFPSFYLLIL